MLIAAAFISCRSNSELRPPVWYFYIAFCSHMSFCLLLGCIKPVTPGKVLRLDLLRNERSEVVVSRKSHTSHLFLRSGGERRYWSAIVVCKYNL